MSAPWQERAHPNRPAMHDALELAERGLPCFPCREDKGPACLHSFKDATTSRAEIQRLWMQFPGPLIGVATGEPSGLFVLDIDSTKHPEADEWLERHAPYLPDTREHRTRSGGLHLLFKHQPGLRNSTSKLALGVDTRGEGGYVIWWPKALGLHAIDEGITRPVFAVPDWLVEALNPPPPKIIPFPVARTRLGNVGAAMTRVEGIITTVAGAREGERNAVTYWAACRLRDMLTGHELDQGTGLQAFISLSEAARRAGLSVLEINRTLLSATRRQK